MRELNTIEVDKWVPSEKKGMVKHAGMISPQEAFDTLKKHLEDVGLLPDEYFLPGTWRYENKSQLPDYRQANCCVNWGGNEGIYLDISLLYTENNEIKYLNFATGKTLGETGDDFLRMSRIAAECSMMLNGRGQKVRFHEEEKGFIFPKDETTLDEKIASAKVSGCPEVSKPSKARDCLENER